MKLQFNHPMEPQLFKFMDNDYKPEVAKEVLLQKIDKLFDFLQLPYTIQEQLDKTNNIKFSDIYKVILINSEFKGKPIDISIKIPNIHNSYCWVSGVKRYVQKQIIDTSFIDMNSEKSERLVCEYATTFSVVKKTDEIAFNVKGMRFLKAIPLYLYLIKESGEINKLEELAQEDDSINNQLQEYITLSQNKLLSSMGPNISSMQKKKTIMLMKTYYHMSEILQEYCDSPADIIYQLIKRISNVNHVVGLDLRTRRLRNAMDIVVSHAVGLLIEFLVNLLFTNKQKKQHVLKIEPYQNLYEFILAETTFNSPLASVSNRSRCTILGTNGFSREGVPVKVRDLHPSQYGNLDPAVTPDRENAGVVLYLASICETDHLGRFKINSDFIEYCKPILEVRHESFNE